MFRGNFAQPVLIDIADGDDPAVLGDIVHQLLRAPADTDEAESDLFVRSGPGQDV